MANFNASLKHRARVYNKIYIAGVSYDSRQKVILSKQFENNPCCFSFLVMF